MKGQKRQFKKIPRADDVEMVEVGRWYMVKAMKLSADWLYMFPVGEWIPVIGEAHKDPQLGVSDLHYHPDLRFFNRTLLNGLYKEENGRTASVLLVSTQDEVDYKPFRCYRTDTGLYIPQVEEDKMGPRFRQYIDWHNTFHGKSCAGKKCPHLGQKMQEIGGKWECPLHGLIGKPKTQMIESRFFSDEAAHPAAQQCEAG